MAHLCDSALLVRPQMRHPLLQPRSHPHQCPLPFITLTSVPSVTSDPAFNLAVNDHYINKLSTQSNIAFRKLSGHLRTKICKLKIKQLASVAQKAHGSPSGVMFTRKRTLAMAQGEVLLISTCHPDTAALRERRDCYQDLLVTYRGKQIFRHSITYALTCSSYKNTFSKRSQPIHLVKGDFLKQGSGKKVEGIEKIKLDTRTTKLRLSGRLLQVKQTERRSSKTPETSLRPTRKGRPRTGGA